MRGPQFCLSLAVILASLGMRPSAALSLGATPPAQSIVVSAAVSLSEALQEAGKAYQSAGGGSVQFNFAASNVLARQIANGAPADVFISADEAQMDYVERAGAIDKATRIPLLGNRLAVVVPPGRRSDRRRPRARRLPRRPCRGRRPCGRACRCLREAVSRARGLVERDAGQVAAAGERPFRARRRGIGRSGRGDRL